MKTLLKAALVLALLSVAKAHAATTVTTNLAAGNYHSLFVASDGSLWAIGDNRFGQLGDGTFNATHRPEQIVSSAAVVIAVAAGGEESYGNAHSLFLKSDGSLWAMGDNSYGQLGDGTYNSTNRPEQIVSSGVIAIAAGAEHSLFLKSGGSLWAMGLNNVGQLGDDTPSQTNKPEQIISSGVIAIAAGPYQSLFIKSDHSLWAMGYWGVNLSSTPVQISTGVMAVAGGYEHTLILKSDGSLWAMGFNDHGELGDGTVHQATTPEQIVSTGVKGIAAGEQHSLFLKSDGSLWAMGRNQECQLGDGTTNNVINPEQIVSSNVVAIAAGIGGFHSLFLKSDGTLWAMGFNYYGQLGDGFSNTNYDTAVSSRPEQIVPSPQPFLAQALVSQSNLQFSATCQFGGNFYLLAGTNLGQPFAQWTPVWTNSVNGSGSNNFTATLTNAVNSGADRQYYILKSQ